MRCFIAVDLDRALVKQVKRVQDRISSLDVDVKFVEPENLHFTLKFLGEVSEGEIKNIINSVGDCVKGFNSFKIGIRGLDYFGNNKYVRTLWLGVDEGKDELVKLMKNVSSCLRAGKEEGTPHLTIGRVKSGGNREILLNFINKYEDVKLGEMVVKNVKLKRSVLTGKGPIYSDLAVFELGGEII